MIQISVGNNKAVGNSHVAMKPVDTINMTAGYKASAQSWLAGISREGLLGVALTVIAFIAVFYLFTRAHVAPDSSPVTSDDKGFRSVLVSRDLSLPQVAENWKYYRNMTSVCHGSGQEEASAAYTYLFYSFDRHSQNGKWSHRKFSRAVDASEIYYEIDPVRDCKPDAINLHGLDINEDLWLKAHALNYVFYSRKVPVCKKAGNKVQARMYMHMMDSERGKLNKKKWSASQVNAAISAARVSPELSKIAGC